MWTVEGGVVLLLFYVVIKPRLQQCNCFDVYYRYSALFNNNVTTIYVYARFFRISQEEKAISTTCFYYMFSWVPNPFLLYVPFCGCRVPRPSLCRGTFLLSPPPSRPHQTLTYANGCGVNTIGTWTNLIKCWLILQHIGRPIFWKNKYL